MKLAQTLFFLVAAALALAVGSANAADDKAKTGSSGATANHVGTDPQAKDPGFNKLDKNHDGYLSRSEAAANPALAKRFKEADRDGDGKLSRSEYLMTMTAQDARSAKNKVENAMGHKENKQSGAGSTSNGK